jgi:hypothetical protein
MRYVKLETSFIYYIELVLSDYIKYSQVIRLMVQW